MIRYLDRIIMEATNEATNAVEIGARYRHGTDPTPRWLWLGSWVTSQGNKAIGAINLNRVVKKYGEEGINALRFWLPEILGIINPWESQKSGQKPEQRPLKSTPSTIGRYDIAKYIKDKLPDKEYVDLLYKIFYGDGKGDRGCYRTPRIDRIISPSTSAFTSMPKFEQPPNIKEAEKILDKTKAEIPIILSEPDEPDEDSEDMEPIVGPEQQLEPGIESTDQEEPQEPEPQEQPQEPEPQEPEPQEPPPIKTAPPPETDVEAAAHDVVKSQIDADKKGPVEPKVTEVKPAQPIIRTPPPQQEEDKSETGESDGQGFNFVDESDE